MLRNINCEIYLYKYAVDMRKSIDGLSLIVADRLEHNPCCGSIYVFYNKSLDKLKLLYWDNNGFCVWYKRLEKESFIIPKTGNNLILSLNYSQLQWLLDGLDINKLRGHKKLKYDQYY